MRSTSQKSILPFESQLNTETKDKNEHSNEKMKNLLKEVLYNSLSQAIIKIILTPHLILKLFLITFVLVTISYSSYLVVQSIRNYLNYGVSTTARTIQETATLFPKVTFCNLNMMQTEYAWNFTQIPFNDFTFLTNDDKKRLGHNLEDILIECYFNGYPCYVNDFVWSFDEFYGNCYTFNSGLDSYGNKTILKESSIAGPNNGLQLLLYVNVYEDLTCSDNLGAIVRIGNSSYASFYPPRSGSLVSSGFQTNIAIDRELKSILPKPYSNCEIDSNSPQFIQDLDLYNLISQSDYFYTQQLCFLQCFQKCLIEKINCTDPNYLSLFKASYCNYAILYDGARKGTCTLSSRLFF